VKKTKKKESWLVGRLGWGEGRGFETETCILLQKTVAIEHGELKPDTARENEKQSFTSCLTSYKAIQALHWEGAKSTDVPVQASPLSRLVFRMWDGAFPWAWFQCADAVSTSKEKATAMERGRPILDVSDPRVQPYRRRLAGHTMKPQNYFPSLPK
jgi:hypothetical protein